MVVVVVVVVEGGVQLWLMRWVGWCGRVRVEWGGRYDGRCGRYDGVGDAVGFYMDGCR